MLITYVSSSSSSSLPISSVATTSYRPHHATCTLLLPPSTPSSLPLPLAVSLPSLPLQPSAPPRKPRGYWDDLTNLIGELRAYVHLHHHHPPWSNHYLVHHHNQHARTVDQMPTITQLRQHHRFDLIKAIQRHGGFAAIAAHLGLSTARTSSRIVRTEQYKQQVCSDVRKLIVHLYVHGYLKDVYTMPTSTLLRKLGYIKLLNKIILLGGFVTVSQLLNMRQHKQYNTHPHRERYWYNDWYTLKSEIQTFCKQYLNNFKPLQKDFVKHRRYDLLHALKYYGGLNNVCKMAEVSHNSVTLHRISNNSRRRYKNYWCDVSVLHAELKIYIFKCGYPGLMPNKQQLIKSNRKDLVYAINKFGGFGEVAKNLHLVWHGPTSFWRKFSNLKKRLLHFVHAKMDGYMPTIEELYRFKRLDLIYGVLIHGGCMKVNHRLGLSLMPRKRSAAARMQNKFYWEKYWRDIKKDLEKIIQIQPLESRAYMPSSTLLVQLGRYDLANSIRDHGGWVYYAQLLGLRLAYATPYRSELSYYGYWQSEANMVKEVLNYLDERYGYWDVPGVLPVGEPHPVSCNKVYLPSSDMFRRDGRSDIAVAISRFHGGIEAFALRNNWVLLEDIVHTSPIEGLNDWVKFRTALLNWIHMHGAVNIMPSKSQLITSARNDLRYAIVKHGGFETVARRLTLLTPHRMSPQAWLALQTAKLVLSLQLEHKPHSPTTAKLLRTLERDLSGSVVGRLRTRRTQEVVGGKGPPARLRTASPVKRQGVERRAVVPIAAVSKGELKTIREKYRHLPADDIISI